MKKQVFMSAFGFIISLLLISGSITATNWTVIKGGGGDFTTISAAINAAANGDVIIISAGTYNESIIVSKELTINGPWAGTAGSDLARGSGEVVIIPAVNLVNGFAVLITASNVTIDGITVDGNMNCVDGILVNGDFNNVKVINNIVRNLIYTDGVTTTPVAGIGGIGVAVSVNNEFSNNFLENIVGSDLFSGPAAGIGIMNNFYADIKNNVMNNVLLGIVISNESAATVFVPAISGNNITTIGCGINLSNYAKNAPAISIIGNTIDFNTAYADKTVGIALNIVKNPNIIVKNNDISNGLAGYVVYAVSADNANILTIDGGNISLNMVGVLTTNVDNNSTPAGLKSTLILNNLNISKSKSYGVYMLGGNSSDGGYDLRVRNSNITNSGDDSFSYPGFTNTMDFAGIRLFAEENKDVSLDVENTAITGNMRGIGINGGGNVLVKGCTISSRDVAGAASVAFRISNGSSATAFTDNVKFENNFFTSPQRCILLQNQNSGNPLVFFNNSFEGIGTVEFQNSVRAIDASGNWWGSALQTDVLAKATAKVDFTPWLNSGTDTDLAAVGFQGDFFWLNVGLSGAQSGLLSRLQEGQDMVLISGTLNILAGTYNESVIVSKEITVKGPWAGTAGSDVARGTGEAIIMPPANLVNGYGILIAANNVTVDGITVDGNMNNVDGILVNGDFNNIKVLNNIVKNLIYTDGITTSQVAGISGLGIVLSDNNDFSNNFIENIVGTDLFNGQAIGILTSNNYYADIKNNVMTNVLLGTVISNESAITEFVPEVSGNQITTSGCGIELNNYDKTAPDIAITGNIINFNTPFADKTAGIALNIVKNPNIIVKNNDLINGLAGYLVYAVPADNNHILTIEGGNISGNMVGVLTTNIDNNSTPAGLKSSFIIKGLNISKSKSYGVYILGGNAVDGGIDLDVLNCKITESGDDSFTYPKFDNPMDFSGIRSLAETNQDVSLSVENSVITGNMRGIGINGGGNVTVKGCTISSRDVAGAASVLFRISNAGTADAFTDNVRFENNFFTSPQRSILLQNQNSGNPLVFFNNSFEGIGHIEFQNSTRIIDASGNWWASALQSDVLTKATSAVDFTPWLNSGIDAELSVVGFQGDFSFLNAGLSGTQTGLLSRLQEGHNLLTEGGTLNAFAGIYTGNLEVSKNLFLSNTGATQIENMIMNGAGKDLTLLEPFDISGILTLTNGFINTTATNTFTLLNNASANGGNNLSFVNGPLKAVNSNPAAVSMNFPIGKKDAGFRDALIDFTQNASTPTTYTAEYFTNGAPALTNIAPVSLTWVAKSFWSISNGGIANFTSPKLTLTYGINDAYMGTNFVIAGSEPNPTPLSWVEKSLQTGISTTSGILTTNTDISFNDAIFAIAPTSVCNITVDVSDINLCNGNTGTLTAIAQTGCDVSYLWSTGETAQNILVNTEGDYCVTVTDCNGCISSTCAHVTVNPLPEVTVANISICLGTSGNLKAISSGVNYLWQDGETTQNIIVVSAGQYCVTVTNTDGCLASACGNVSVNALPSGVILTPLNSTKNVGDNITFNVSIGSGTVPYYYKWYKDGSLVGSNVAYYTINSIKVADAGNYFCVVSNICGNTSSNISTLNVSSVCIPPVITQNPQNVTKCYKDYVSFSVKASGKGLTYQWQENAKNIHYGWSYLGINSPTLYVFNISSKNGKIYRCIVSNTCTSVTSNGALLTINTPPEITQKPQNKCVTEGSSVTFNVTATGTGLTYQWLIGGHNLTDGTLFSGTKTPILTISNATGLNNKQFRVIVSNECGSESARATLVVKASCSSPTNLRYKEVSNYSVKMLWDEVSGAKKYDIAFRNGNSSKWSYYSTNSSKLTLSNLKSNTNYCFKVSTTCFSCGCSYSSKECMSNWSDEVCFNTTNYNKNERKNISNISDSDNGMNVYPNPTSGMLNISLPVTNSSSELTIYDMTGKKVYGTQISALSTQLSLDMSVYQQGVYFIRLSNDQLVKTIKVILQ